MQVESDQVLVSTDSHSSGKLSHPPSTIILDKTMHIPSLFRYQASSESLGTTCQENIPKYTFTITKIDNF